MPIRSFLSGVASAFVLILFVALCSPHCFLNTASASTDEASEAVQVVSFANDVRPLLAEKCFGCHQPAQSRGAYVMTDFVGLLSGGDSGEPAIVPSDPDQSRLLEMIIARDGKAEMPPAGDPLSADQVDLIQTWILQGANNDFSRQTKNYSATNLPTYSHLPNLSALDVSPAGDLIAVSGFNEILLLRFPDIQDASVQRNHAKIEHRLVGLSSRIESVQFSPDGKRLAAAGGIPGELGEIQVWNLADEKLLLSKIVSHDTVYGISWSPDGSKLSFGCTDSTLRVIIAESGEQVLFQGAHEDWVRDTVFSVDGSQLVSVGRDMSCKLIDVATQRFIDNITSITPGSLKGGIASVARHPDRDEVLIGGADGIPKIYRLNRLTKRVIGDDANLIRKMPSMPGRIQSVAISRDGTRLAAASSLDGSSSVRVFSYEFNTEQPENIKAIVSKTVDGQSAEEKQLLEAHVTQDVVQLSATNISETGIYAIDFHPSGRWLVAGGRDGLIRVMETNTGKLIASMPSIETNLVDVAKTQLLDWHFQDDHSKSVEGTPVSTAGQTTVTANLLEASRLVISPTEISFRSPIDYCQLVVQAELPDGTRFDVTHEAELSYDSAVVSATEKLIQATGDGETEIEVVWNRLSASIPVRVQVSDKDFEPDFIRDVNPVLSKLGCNAGTCHGSQGGKKGFKLSLRGYDPIYDIRSFTDDMAGRRTDLASPAASLMLLKPTTQVAHEGGKLFDPNSRYYHLVEDWIRAGAALNLETGKAKSIEIFPKNATLADAGSFQQIRVVAHDIDGTTRDVTREAIIETGNQEVASTKNSVVQALRRGEAPILARYEGAFAATMVTVMGDRDDFIWTENETWGTIDQLTAEKWNRLKIVPSALCSDDEFIRRIYLDLCGLPPTADQVESFLADQRPTRTKRDVLIEQLIGNDDFVEHWSNKWADMLQVNRKYLGADGALAFRNWIRQQIKSNRPYDEFVHEILTATGSNHENPPASYFKIHRTPDEVMENTTHLFLATRFNCNKCHDHPFERWTQDQYFETAAFFAQIGREKDPAGGDQTVGGSAVEGATPLYEFITDLSNGDLTHERTGQTVAPKFPFECEHAANENQSRREELAAWITSKHNPYFATSYVNRLWGYLIGTGLIEPLDDIRAGNPASNPALLERLRSEFVDSNFDVRHIVRLICKSRTYQLSVKTNAFNADDQLNASHAKARRLPAEVLFDSIHLVTGSPLNIPGVAPGTRAAAIPDSGISLPSGFLETLGRPARESACECERTNDLQLGSVLALVSGPDLSKAINNPANKIANLVQEISNNQELIDRLYLRVLNRHASEAEFEMVGNLFSEIESDHTQLVGRRDAARAEFEKRLPDLETQRLSEIESVTKELEEIVATITPNLQQLELEHATRLTATTNELDQYQKHAIGFEDWKQRQLFGVQWHPLNVLQFETTSGRGYSVLEDRSLLLQSKPSNDIYTIVTATDLSGISAVRLELLPHDSLPMKGPGLAPNGNLVLSEFELEIAHPDTPEQWQRVEFSGALASYEQPQYSVGGVLDGSVDNRAGWALADRQGQSNWATFQLKLPIGFSGGTRLRFRLHQNHDEQHQIGRLRLSVSKCHQAIGLGLSEPLLAELIKPEPEWSDEIRTRLTTAFERGDPHLMVLKEELKAAQQPLVIAPEIIELREKLTRVSKPVPRDPALVQLESDVEVSAQQLKNSRLTAAQDLTWALINSPAFLFNH